MTPEEKLREEIFLKDFSTFNYSPNNQSIKFNSFVEFKSFIKKEIEFWQKYSEQSNYHQVVSSYNQFKNRIDNLETSKDENNIRQQFRDLRRGVEPTTIVISNSVEAQFLTRLYDNNPSLSNIVYNILIKGSSRDLNTINGIYAAIAVYEFIRSENLGGEEKFSSERLDRLASEYKNTISQISSEHSKLMNSFEQSLAKSHSEFDKSNKEFNEMLNAKKKLYDDTMKDWKDEIVKLEKYYDEKLMLSKPAEYWDRLRNIYEKKGNMWKKYSICATIIFVVLLIVLLFTLPDWLHGDFKIDHIKAIVIFTLIVTVSTYLIHLFIKLSTSSFHLSRDAEERRQLTFLFLSLMKEGKIEQKEREIVFQSLFSRADTGLLKSDSTPAIPGNLGDMLSKLSGKN